MSRLTSQQITDLNTDKTNVGIAVKFQYKNTGEILRFWTGAFDITLQDNNVYVAGNNLFNISEITESINLGAKNVKIEFPALTPNARQDVMNEIEPEQPVEILFVILNENWVSQHEIPVFKGTTDYASIENMESLASCNIENQFYGIDNRGNIRITDVDIRRLIDSSDSGASFISASEEQNIEWLA